MLASADPTNPNTAVTANRKAINGFMFPQRNGAGAGFEPVCGLAWPCSPLSPRVLACLNFNGERGLGSQRHNQFKQLKGVN